MRAKKRYSLFNVFWVVATLNLLLFIMAFVIIKFLQTNDVKNTMDNLLSLKYLLKSVASIAFQTLFYYFSMNYYNQMMLTKKKAGSYVIVSLFLFVVAFAYFWIMHYLFPEMSGDKDGKATPEGLFILSFVISAVFCSGMAVLIAYLNNLREEKKQRKVL